MAMQMMATKSHRCPATASAVLTREARTLGARSVLQSMMRGAALTPASRSVTNVTLPNIEKTIATGTRYAGVNTVTLLPGDGIGAELADAVVTIFKAARAPIEWEEHRKVSGHDARDKNSAERLKAAVDSIKRNKVALKGIFSTPMQGGPSLNVALRRDLDIYASVALIKNIPGVQARHNNVDFVIIRENTEGEYSGLEHSAYPGVIESLKVVTKAKTERIAQFAFDFALKNGRKKVTCVHKANIMKLGDGLFLNTCRNVASTYSASGINFNDMIVDNTAMQLVSKPQQFDVMVMPNLYGTITSNIGAGLIGGPGLVPGANIGRDFAIFEPGCRHVGSSLQGKNLANPTSMIFSGVLLLRHLGHEEHANRIANAVYKVISQGKVRTADLGGSASTTDFTTAVVSQLE